MIEAELKAHVRASEVLRAQLRHRADEEISIYRDTYYDRPDRELTAEGRELRVRVVETEDVRRSILTYKEPAVDAASGSKPEHETKVADRHGVDGAGHGAPRGLRKALRELPIHRPRWGDMLAKVVTVPEIDGTFIELETMAEEWDTAVALDDVRAVLHELGMRRT